jgi:hypothetical protein
MDILKKKLIISILFSSPIKNNPLVDIGANKQTLQLAINTAQYGRVNHKIEK